MFYSNFNSQGTMVCLYTQLRVVNHCSLLCRYSHEVVYIFICDRLQENRAQRGVRKYRETIDRFLKNVLFQADGRERLGLL